MMPKYIPGWGCMSQLLPPYDIIQSSNQLLWSSNQPHTNHPPKGSNLRLSQGWTPKDTFGKRWFSTQHFAHSANGRGANLEFWDRKTQPGQHTTVGCRGLSITFEEYQLNIKSSGIIPIHSLKLTPLTIEIFNLLVMLYIRGHFPAIWIFWPHWKL